MISRVLKREPLEIIATLVSALHLTNAVKALKGNFSALAQKKLSIGSRPTARVTDAVCL